MEEEGSDASMEEDGSRSEDSINHNSDEDEESGGSASDAGLSDGSLREHFENSDSDDDVSWDEEKLMRLNELKYWRK